MTSDAKVGLLLGLVFIFVIAFIINGLPRFHRPANNSELTTNMVNLQDGSSGIAARERGIPGVFDRPEPSRRQSVEEVPLPSQDNQGVRFEMQLPQNPSVVKDISFMDTFKQVEPAAQSPITNKKPEPAKSAQPKIYVVSEGDNLAEIAKKFYGAVEGNKRINITRIFQANRQLLKSPDAIYVGQKLIIPALNLTQDQGENDQIFSSDLFEKVKSIGRNLLADSPEAFKAEQSKQYVVQEGDSLWLIAAEQLGNGSRYTDISKLNADVLEDEDSLTVGMRLRLPVR